jgi:hypothetical protein
MHIFSTVTYWKQKCSQLFCSYASDFPSSSSFSQSRLLGDIKQPSLTFDYCMVAIDITHNITEAMAFATLFNIYYSAFLDGWANQKTLDTYSFQLSSASVRICWGHVVLSNIFSI